jgi:protein TonB
VKKFQKQVEDAKKDPKKKISSTIVVKKKGDGSTHTMGQPPKIIVDSYPPEGIYTFKGVVRVFATIGEDGKIKKTKVAVTSGRRSVDELAMAFCRRWTFKPALDSKGQPMECIKLIRIPFNLPPEKMKDQIDRNT